VELGAFWSAEFKAGGVPHRLVVAGATESFDGDRLVADMQKICEPRSASGTTASGRRFKSYLFMLNAVDDGYGGLEHRNSTALIASRRDLPRLGERARRRLRHAAGPDQPRVLPHLERQALRPGGVRALRLHARELHAAAVVLRGLHQLLRRPAAAPRRADRRRDLPEAAEQDLQPGAADAGPRGAVGGAGQLRRLGEVLPAGREHANATVSYYTKGALVALCFDLTLRPKATPRWTT
jgi:hypothetical protein